MASSVPSKQFTNNTAASLGSQNYLDQIKNEGVERCFPINGNGFITNSPTQGGTILATTSATGATWVRLSAQASFKATISNQSGTSIDVKQGVSGAAFTIPTGQIFTFEGIANTDELYIKRTDNSNTQVTVGFRWAL